jgi:hypothetical protein
MVSLLSHGLLPTTFPMKPAQTTKQEDGTMVLIAQLKSNAKHAHQEVDAKFLTATTFMVLINTVRSLVNKL